MTMKEKEITLKIESAEKGHETVCLPMSKAVSRIEQETEQNGKWLYCDGRYTQTDIATDEGRTRLMSALAQASDITLAGMLQGGEIR